MKQTKLCQALMLTLLCSLTASAHDFAKNGIYYDIVSSSDLTVSVTWDSDNYGEYRGAITIPSTVTYNGKTYRVTGIGSNAFNGCRGLTSVTIPESVTSIGIYAFDGCCSLTSVTLPEGVTSIGDYAFEYCEKLTSINIPEGVTSIEYHTFYGCSSLTSINIPESVTSIGDQAFEGCRSLTAINIPEGVTSIGGSAFTGCSGLTTIIIADGNTIYDSREGCNAIIETSSNTLITGCSTTVIPQGVTSIGYGAFYECSSLATINIPDGVTSIGNSAFYGCSSLTAIIIPESVTSIGSSAFYNCSGLIAINIPESVTSIEYNTFYGCSSLTAIIIPESVTSIGSSAFYGCSSLTAIIIPESVTSIEYDVFRNCRSLTSVNIGEGVTSIGSSAFYGCSSLASIIIPESVTSIGSSAFYGTVWYSNLPDGVVYVGKILYEHKGTMPENTNIEIKEGTVSIGGYAFHNCSNLTAITIPESVTNIEYGAFDNCSGLTAITLPESVTNIEYYTFRNCSSLAFINIPKSVTSIGNEAFKGCSSLTSITIPESVTSIGGSAFDGCAGELYVSCNIPSYSFNKSRFSKAIIGSSVTSIGNFAFANCASLKEVVFEDGSETLSLGFNKYSSKYYDPSEGLFYDCPLEYVYLGRNLSYNSTDEYGYSPFYHKDRSPVISLGNGITTIPSYLFKNNESLPAIIVIPENVTSIARYAFSGCTNLRVVVIPENVTSIENWAFSGCSNIKVVVCNADVSINDYTGLSYVDRILKGEYIDGCIFNGQKGAYVLAAYVGENEELVLPKTYKGQKYSIGDYAFNYCPNLTSVTIPDGVTSIGYAAFSGTSLISVEIPSSVQSIARGVFCEYEMDDALLEAAPLRTVVSRSHVPARMIDGVPAEEQVDDKNLIFSNYTYIHAPLYVPEGAYWDYAYAIGWGDFINIKEMITEVDNLQSCKAYMVADAEGCNYTVYDTKEKNLKNVAYTHSLDEKSEDCCWTVLREDGKTYLYSLGAKKFATISDKGSIALSDTPVSITITDDEKGLNVNGSNLMFVLNKNVKADVTVRTKYLVTFKIGNEVIAADSLEYGASIVAPEAPAKEGYTFNGWGEVDETVPARDVTYEGSYSANSYLLTFVVDGEIVQSDSVAYGTAIVLPEEPAKEGYTFSGWSEAPETMPAEDVTISGTFVVNKYLVTFKIGDEVIASDSLEYGATIVTPEAPEKEGYTFNGWGEVDETVPARDVTYEGSYSVNSYLLTFVVDGEVFATETVDYGADITAPEIPEREGYTFAWVDEVPETMPAKDITIHGAYTEIAGITDAAMKDDVLYIYTLDGLRTDELRQGINIVLMKDGSIRKVLMK